MIGRCTLGYLATVGCLGGTLAMAPHPLHTTLAVFTAQRDGSMTISVRAFADDFGAAVRLRAGDRTSTTLLPPDAAIESYTRATLQLTDGAGRPVALGWCGARHEGDLLWLCLAVPATARAGQLRLRDALLVEHFDDQVNIVQILRNDHRSTMLFTKADRAKALSD